MGGGAPFTPSDIKPGPERALLETWYAAAVKKEPALGPPPGAMGAGRATVQRMLERLLRSRSFAGVAQRAFIGNLKQVNAFLGDSAVKDRVLERVADEVGPDTEVVIGHSLGSIVTYEFLARYKPSHVKLHVTLGSPLGIPNLVFERLTPVPEQGVGAWPGNVHEWVNVADPDDVVALRKQLSPLFPPEGGAAAVQDALVDNGDEPHSISRYLNALPTGAALGGVL